MHRCLLHGLLQQLTLRVPSRPFAAAAAAALHLVDCSSSCNCTSRFGVVWCLLQVGRLAGRNPAHINPAMRRHLLQLLTDMEHSPDSRLREGKQLASTLVRPTCASH
jgi:hypothetical protein